MHIVFAHREVQRSRVKLRGIATESEMQWIGISCGLMFKTLCPIDVCERRQVESPSKLYFGQVKSVSSLSLRLRCANSQIRFRWPHRIVRCYSSVPNFVGSDPTAYMDVCSRQESTVRSRLQSHQTSGSKILTSQLVACLLSQTVAHLRKQPTNQLVAWFTNHEVSLL